MTMARTAAVDPKLLDKDPARISRMFAEVSSSYDLLNRVLSFGRDGSWRNELVKMAHPEGARRVLDLATGTGDLALAFARAGGFRGSVVGIDFSAEMVQRAREKAEHRGFAGRVLFREGDALETSEPDETFDIVSVGFGARNFSDLEKALSEARRVLAPGGRLAVLEFFRAKELPAIRLYLDEVVPRVGRWISQSESAYAYLRHSSKGFLATTEFVALLEKLRFASIDAKALTFGIAHSIVGTKGP
jgi:demethylmenaquinone methyltransferase/2-methoxy-6-polyprenyl-1,4-benzoquinol methylase